MSEYYLTNDELYHYGVAGQKWGRRQYQNEDGSLTDLGRQHYGYGPARSMRGTGYRALSKVYGLNERTYNKLGNKTMASMNRNAKNEMLEKASRADADRAKYKNSKEYKERSAKVKKAIKVGAIVAGTALAAYGAYKVSKYVNAKRVSAGKNITATKKFQETLNERYGAIAMNPFVNKESRDQYYEKYRQSGEAIRKINEDSAGRAANLASRIQANKDDYATAVAKRSERALASANRAVDRNFAGIEARRKLSETASNASSKIKSARDQAKLNAASRSINRDLNSASRKANLSVLENRIRKAADTVSKKASGARQAAQYKRVDDLYNDARAAMSKAKYYEARRIAGNLTAEKRATAQREYSKALNELNNIYTQITAMNRAANR